MSDPFSDNARRTGPALEQTYRFLLWLIPTVDKFPRKHKFRNFGDIIRNCTSSTMPCLFDYGLSASTID